MSTGGSMNKIITISRQFGAGGHSVAKLVAENLGVECYDSILLDKLAEETGFEKEYIKDTGEASLESKLWSFFSGHAEASQQDYLWIAHSRIIEELADKGPCVIVGRSADFVLREKKNLVSVFLHASKEFRIKRIKELYGEKENITERTLADIDKRRASYYQYYTDRKWGDVENYTLSLDTSVLGVKKCAEIITMACGK